MAPTRSPALSDQPLRLRRLIPLTEHVYAAYGDVIYAWKAGDGKEGALITRMPYEEPHKADCAPGAPVAPLDPLPMEPMPVAPTAVELTAALLL